jgi:Mce-associated membrane protein
LTAVIEEAVTQEVTEEAVTLPPVASWPSRAGAFALDVLLGLGVIATIAAVALTATFGSWLWWLSVAVGATLIMAMAVNRLLLPAAIGWSLGRCLLGIAVTRRDGERPGPWWLLARDLAHLLDTASLFIGWLWPLWDSRNRTFADLLVRTEVRPAERPEYNVRRLVAAVMAAAVVLSAAFVGLSYLTVYRHDRAVDQARAEIQAQGPHMVEDVLSYGAGSMQKDFARAQTLVTDGYRKQLMDQQQAVGKTGAMTNEYWVVNSAVISATPDKATMLLAMQGQRQANQQPQRFITATTRVSFEKSHDGHWRVADLTVLTKPVLQPNAAPAPPPGPNPGGGK